MRHSIHSQSPLIAPFSPRLTCVGFWFGLIFLHLSSTSRDKTINNNKLCSMDLLFLFNRNVFLFIFPRRAETVVIFFCAENFHRQRKKRRIRNNPITTRVVTEKSVLHTLHIVHSAFHIPIWNYFQIFKRHLKTYTRASNICLQFNFGFFTGIYCCCWLLLLLRKRKKWETPYQSID